MKVKQKGFSLIEVMIVIVIVGLMAAFAAPEFRTRTVKAQIGGAVTELQASLAMARSEALRNGRYAVIEPSTKGNDFTGGWVVKVPTASGDFTAATFRPPKGLSQFTLVKSPTNTIKFFGDGRADTATDAHFCIKAAAATGELHRKVILTKAGQALVLNESC